MAVGTSPAMPYLVPQKTQDSIIEFCKSTTDAAFNTFSLRERFTYIDKEYIRENSMAVDQQVQSRSSNEMGNKRKIQDIVIPIVEPQVATSLAYLASVFCTGIPIFGVVSNKQNMDQAKQLEAVISSASMRGGWARELILFFLDGLKYNFQVLEVPWCVEKIYSLETDVKFSTKEAKPTEIVWQGPKLIRRDPYNVFFDPRVPITEQHKKAEFVGYAELYSRVALAIFLHSLPYRMNVTKAYESSPMNPTATSQGLYYIPEIFTDKFSGHKLNGVMNWDSWAMGGKSNDVRTKFKNLYQVVTRYVRIIPNDFGMQVPNRGQPQVWKFITVNDKVLVYAERLTNAHGYLPLIFGQPTEDGLNLQTKSLAQKLIPLQDLASSLANSKLAARRRLIADRGLYDPSRINEKDINSDNPAAKIPVRPSAYGQDIQKSYYQMPFRDEQTQSLMADVREVFGYAESVSGQNKAQQGQFVKGNKTRSEYEDVQGKSSGRQQAMAIMAEYQVFTPLKEILKLDILQYQPAGPMYSYSDKQEYNVDPVKLRESSLVFKVSDGLIPADKLIEADILTAAFQVMGTSPALQQEYNVGDIFSYLMSMKGADLSQFKFTEEQIKARSDMGNQRMIANAQAEAIAKQGVVPNATQV